MAVVASTVISAAPASVVVAKRAMAATVAMPRTAMSLARRLHAAGLDHAQRVRIAEEPDQRLRGLGTRGLGAHPGREQRDELQLRRKRSDQLDARDRQQLADLLHRKLGLALGNQFREQARLRAHLGLDPVSAAESLRP